MLGVNTPDKFGGVGGDVLSTAVTWEEQYVVYSINIFLGNYTPVFILNTVELRWLELKGTVKMISCAQYSGP